MASASRAARASVRLAGKGTMPSASRSASERSAGSVAAEGQIRIAASRFSIPKLAKPQLQWWGRRGSGRCH
jgi:hypothetical protein